MTVLLGDCLEVMRTLEAESVDAIVTDPPYALTANKKGGSGAASVNLDSPYGRARIGTGNGAGGFMGKAWDSAIPGPEIWAEALRVAKPGAHLLAFGGTRTFHRLTCAIEDAGWEIRDSIGNIGLLGWVTGQGFPKSLNVSADEEFCHCHARSQGKYHDVSDEGLPRVRDPLAAEDSVSVDAESDVLGGVHRQTDQPSEQGHPKGDNGHHTVRDLRQGDQEAEGVGEAGDRAFLLEQVQRGKARPRVGETRPQGAGGVDSPERGQLQGEDERREKSGVARRRHDVQEEGELQGNPLPPSAGVGAADGAEGRLHHGAPPRDGDDGGPAARADGGGASPEPRSHGQPAGEPGALAVEQPTQERGAWPTCMGCGKPMVPSGLGTALKPSWEPIILARKPLPKGSSVAATVSRYGTGAINIAACRIAGAKTPAPVGDYTQSSIGPTGHAGTRNGSQDHLGRWPANCVLSHVSGPDGCREVGTRKVKGSKLDHVCTSNGSIFPRAASHKHGHTDADGTETVAAWVCHPDCPIFLLDQMSGERKDTQHRRGTIGSAKFAGKYNNGELYANTADQYGGYTDSGGASRFFLNVKADRGDELRFGYFSKASRAERERGLEGMPRRESGAPMNSRCASCGKLRLDHEASRCQCADHVAAQQVSRAGAANGHPCVKPLQLMRWLCRLITPPGGLILDPFTGSGSTGCAAVLEGFRFLGIEREAEYVAIAERRLAYWSRVARRYHRFRQYLMEHPRPTASRAPVDPDQGSLFGEGAA